MRTVSIRLCDMEKANIPIGFVGENLYTQVRIDSKKVFDDYPTAIASLTIVNPHGDVYPGFVTRDGDVIIWTVENSDLVYGGNGKIQLAFLVDDIVAKSYECRTYVSKALISPDNIPTPIASWIDAANVVLGEAEGVFEALDEMTVAAETLAAGTSATAEISDVDGHKHIAFGIPKGDKGDQGNPGVDGSDGYSPTLVVSTITGGHRITITDKNGTSTVDIMDGEKGDTGATGNGIASVTLNQDYTLTITYTNGQSYTTTSIRGAKGETGETGATPVISIGTVTTGDPDDPASATMDTTDPKHPVLSMVIPQGQPGSVPIDDTSTDPDKVWSAQKTSNEVNDVKNAIKFESNKNAIYLNELERENIIVPIVVLRTTDLVEYPILNGSIFEIYSIDGQAFDTNKVKMYASDGTTLLNEWSLASGSDNPRVITNNSGDGKYVKLESGTDRGIGLVQKAYATESVYLTNRVNDISNQLIANQTVCPFVVLRTTELVEFHIPTKSNLVISTIDGKAFDTNTVERYDSNGTTKLGDWNVVPGNGTSRSVTYNGNAVTYLKLVNATTRGIKVTLQNAVKQPKKIRVMQYNIGKFNYGHGGGLAEDVATKIANYKRFLAQYQPNICGIEEYTQYIDSSSSYATDATLFNDLYFFGDKDFDVELAVKSDYACRNFYNFYIKDDNNETAGSFVEYKADIEKTEVIVVAGAIAAGKSSSVRSGGFENLLKKYSSNTNVVILIDTNVISAEEHTALVTTAEGYGYKVANGGYFGTFDTYNLNSEYYHKIDNVLVKGNIVMKNVIVPDVYSDLSSDQYPRIAEIELKVD